MGLMIRLSVAKICFGMVLADDILLDTESCQLWICQRNNDFWKNTNKFHCNGILITDVFSWWFLKSVMASDIHIFLHILLPMMIRIFSWIYFSGGLANGTMTIFGMGMRHIRWVRSMDGHSVQMLAWNGKFRAQTVKVLYPTLHSIPSMTLCIQTTTWIRKPLTYSDDWSKKIFFCSWHKVYLIF